MRDEICPYCSKDITGDYKHRCNQYHVALPKMPSELLLLATDPLMGEALAKWVVDIQSSTADQFRQAKVKVLREAAEWFEAYGNKGFSVINLRHNQPVEGTDMKPVLCVSEKELRRMNEGDKWIKAWLPPTTMAENVELYTADQLREAQVKVLREAVTRLPSYNENHVILGRMADELEK